MRELNNLKGCVIIAVLSPNTSLGRFMGMGKYYEIHKYFIHYGLQYGRLFLSFIYFLADYYLIKNTTKIVLRCLKYNASFKSTYLHDLTIYWMLTILN